jgi:hypothetical protein
MMEFRSSESATIDKLSIESVITELSCIAVADELNITLPNSGHDLSGKAQCGKSEYSLYSEAISSHPK